MNLSSIYYFALRTAPTRSTYRLIVVAIEGRQTGRTSLKFLENDRLLLR